SSARWRRYRVVGGEAYARHMRVIAIAAGLFLLASSAGCGSAGGAPATGSVSATLNSHGYGSVNSISCTAAGECAAGGYYLSGGRRAFVVSETNGSWGKPIEVPAMSTLDSRGY